MDEIWDERRKRYHERVRESALALFEHLGGTDAVAFVIDLDPDQPGLIVAAGQRSHVSAMLAFSGDDPDDYARSG